MSAAPLQAIPRAARNRVSLYPGTAMDPAKAAGRLYAWHNGQPVPSGPVTIGRITTPPAELTALSRINTAYGPVYPPQHTPGYTDANFAALSPVQQRAIILSDYALRYIVLADASRSNLVPTEAHDLSRVAAGQYQAAGRNLGWHVDGRWRVKNRYPGFTAIRYNVVIAEEGITGTEYAVGEQRLSNIVEDEDTLSPDIAVGGDAPLQLEVAQPGDVQRWISEIDAHQEPPAGEGFRMLVTDSNLLGVSY